MKSSHSEKSAKQDAGKLRLTLVPHEIIRAIARVRMYGTKKYGSADNWKRERILTHLKETKKGTKTPAWVRIEE